MRAKSLNSTINDTLLSQLWFRNHPETIRAIFSADETTSLTNRAATADKIFETITTKQINQIDATTIQKNDDIIELKELIEKLNEKFNKHAVRNNYVKI